MRTSIFAIILVACGGASPRIEMPHPGAQTASFVPATIDAVHGAFVGALAEPVTSFGAAWIDGEPCVLGGYHGTPHDYDREGQSAAFMCSHRTRASMETGLQGFSFAPLDGGLVRCGGSRIDNAPGAATDMHSIATCRRYVAETDAWESFADLPAPRSSFDAAVLGERMYAIGGWNIEGDQDHATFAQTMDVFDGSAWSSTPAPISRRALAVVATTHAIVAVGGLDASLHASRAVDVFDPSTHAWSQGPEFPGDGFGMAAIAVGDAIYASGADGAIYRWNIGEASWSHFAALAQPRFFHRLLASSDALVAVGGIGAMTIEGRAALIEQVSLASPSRAIGWVDLSFPGRARNRFGMFATDDSLYVLGGNDSPEQHDFAPENFVAEAFRLHVPSLRWYAVAPLPEARQSIESVVIGDALVMFGGFGHDGHAARTFADAFVLRDDQHVDIVRNVLPTGRTQFGITVYGDAVWIFAGLIFDESLPQEQQFTHLDDVLRCPIVAAQASPIGACETVAHLSGTRRAFASAAIGSHFYIVGGMREGFASVDDCLDFDLEARSFTTMTCPAHPRVSATMLAHDGYLYLAGGSARTSEGLSDDASIERFDPANGTWSTVIDALPFGTHQGRWAFVGDRLVMLSTQETAGHATLAIVDVASP